MKEPSPVNVRSMLKIVRNERFTCFDQLPTGETVGAFANREAVRWYTRKLEGKRGKKRKLQNPASRAVKKPKAANGHGTDHAGPPAAKGRAGRQPTQAMLSPIAQA